MRMGETETPEDSEGNRRLTCELELPCGEYSLVVYRPGEPILTCEKFECSDGENQWEWTVEE